MIENKYFNFLFVLIFVLAFFPIPLTLEVFGVRLTIWLRILVIVMAVGLLIKTKIYKK